MIKNRKIILLIGLLSLCLLLAGCGQQDRTDTGSADISGQFATLPPREQVTVTPDAVADIPEGTEGGVLPGEINMDVFATPEIRDPVFTSAPEASPIPAVTAAPATPTPTAGPTPTPKSLQVGFTGSDAVRAMQKKLKELGYYSGSVDGDFGPSTEAAVIAFQKANGLTADGKAGEKTLAKMNSAKAVSAKGSSSAGTTSSDSSTIPSISTNIYLSPGSKGKNVKKLQNRLVDLGWLSGSASGTYDDATEAAVIAFQKKAKLWADGKAGPKTLELLFSAKAPKGSNPVSAGGETLEKGSKGNEVKKLQKRLISLGYLSGTADGKFGDATESALIAFQENNGLAADGKAGTATLNRLYSDEAKKNRASD